jgi:hypothetical protein
MTPLIKEMVKLVSVADFDPTQMQWFDVTALFKNNVDWNPKKHLLHPAPYKNMMLCGKTEQGDFMLSVLTEPTATIVTGWIIKPTGYKVLGSFLFAEDNGEPKVGEVDKPIDPKDQRMMVGIVAKFYASLDMKVEAYVPTVKDTFTNRRKIAEGKLPTYDWNTVVIEPSKPKQEHQGGTHASPRRHQARGHWRTYKSGKRGWVKECWRGDASKGAVFKDYELKEKNT